MAMIDYGAIIIKDGKQINFSMFQDMTEAVGWSDSVSNHTIFHSDDGSNWTAIPPLNGNYFCYCGDQDFTIAFYKTWCRFGCLESNAPVYGEVPRGKKTNTVIYNGVSVKIKCICNYVYLASFVYKNSRYNVIFGYGIEPDAQIWNKIKVRYLGKKNSKKVDRLIKKYTV